MLQNLTEKDRAALQALALGDNAANSFLHAPKAQDCEVYGIWHDGLLVGAAQLECEKSAFLYVYIAKPFRKQGLGTSAVRLCEERLKAAAPDKIETYWLSGDESAKRFAKKHGCAHVFSSALMRYSGVPFTLSDLPVRAYEDADYGAAQALSARAFHKMRLRVGAFPDSRVQQPSEEMRAAWKSAAAERFVYEQNGEIVGYAHLEGDAIDSVAIKPEAQGRGIGRLFVKRLCNEILKSHRSVTLYCVVGNWARSLYDSLGFREEYVEEYGVKRLRHPL